MCIATIRQWALAITSRLLALSLCLLVLLECIEIVLRYGFATTLLWSADVSALLLLSLGWLGAGHLWIARNHLVVDLFQGRFPRFFKYTSVAAEVVALSGLIWLTPKVMQVMAIYADIIMPALEVPAIVRFIPLALGMSLIFLGTILNLLTVMLNATGATA
ncbi:MAG: TRAP transporter small permease subunit [Thiolinea sp.]